MNHKKSISILVVMSFLMTAFAVSVGSVRANPSDWNEGQVWGYKWQYNLADLKSDIEKQIRENATIEALNISGGISEYFYVKYLGKDSDGYKFEFKGGSYAEMNYYIKIKNKTSDVNSYEKAETYTSSDFGGTFWLIKDSENYAFPYYGISKIKCEVSSDADQSYRVENPNDMYISTWEITEKGSVEFKNLVLDFSPSVPMLPADMENPQNIQSYTEINVAYSGDRSGNLSYYENKSGPFTNGTKQTDSANQDLSKHIANSTQIEVSNYTMLILGLPGLCVLFPENGTFQDIDLYAIRPSHLSMKYDNSFISSMKIDNMYPLSYTIASKPATEDEVNEYLQDKKGHTPGISNENGNTNGNDFLLIGAIIGIIAAVAVAALVLVMRRKKKMPPEMYGAYYQQTQDIQQIPENPQPPQGDYQEPPRF